MTASPSEDERDYRKTLLLPRTPFSMKAGLPAKEKIIVKRWEDDKLFQTLRRRSQGRPRFILHDGPPYANGKPHIGTALNKILKDIIVRTRQMSGCDANYVPGWDCHGLPIEWEVEAEYRRAGRNKDEVCGLDFRRQCRDFAQSWIDVQREGFKRLGVIGDWDHPYATMAASAEAAIIAELHKFLMDGSLYRGGKPVLWSTVERTALAEAEIEYRDRVSIAVTVKFPLRASSTASSTEWEGVSAAIWTTTPWTLPGNRAIAFAENVSYGLYQSPVDAGGLRAGEILAIADDRADAVAASAGLSSPWRRLGDAPPLEGLICSHPLSGQGYDFDVPLHAGSFVAADEGSGLVHIAPGHGHDDYALGVRHGLEIADMIDEDGVFREATPLFAGKRVFDEQGGEGDANDAVIAALRQNDALIAAEPYRHNYPHSWRSKAPLMLRNTPQWFVSMDKTDLRQKALKAIDEVSWIPESGRNRIQAMVAERPDWVLSRQRRWGVPLAIFVDAESGEPLRDPDVNRRIRERVAENGIDAWFETDPAVFLGEKHDPQRWRRVDDILDVWFESGCTHAFVLESRSELGSPADLYLEGSDQHRGWFQSSLLESCATRGRAPYRAVLTHGFVLDENGRKMSKSLGNIVAPEDIVERDGADVLRLWCALIDYRDDVRIGEGILAGAADSYRKIRNTLRFMLGNLAATPEGGVADLDDFARFPDLERWVLHRLWEIDDAVAEAFDAFDFKRAVALLQGFMINDLSSFYFDIRKDALYCDAPHTERRRAAVAVIARLFDDLIERLAPILCFTAEEARRRRYGEDSESIHLQTFTPAPKPWRDDRLAERIDRLRKLRRVAAGALEIARHDKRIGSGLDAALRIHIEDPTLAEIAKNADLAEFTIVSAAVVAPEKAPPNAFRLENVPGVAVAVAPATGRKCRRSWRILPEVGSDPDYPDLSLRDANAVRAFLSAKPS